MPVSRTSWVGSLLAIAVMAVTVWTMRVPVQGANECVGKPYGYPGCPSIQGAASSSSRPPHCGDGNVQTGEGEECDLATYNGMRECSVDCKLLFCGDGIVSPQLHEECEPQVQDVYVDRNGVLGVERQFVAPSCGRYCNPPVLNKKGEVISGCTYAFGPSCTASGSSSSRAVAVPAVSSATSSAVASSAAVPSSVVSSAASPSRSSAVVSLSAGPACGNGIKEPGEQCDDGALNSDTKPGACRTNCQLPLCGDGVVDPGEQCDDGNTDDTDGCSNSCRLPVCGDGVVQGDEECDDGNKVNDDYCTNACRLARCGDGILQKGEECDDGNNVNDDGCSNHCTLPVCGNGIREAGEECDEGSLNSDTKPGACRTSCKLPRCGDGVIDPDEECDGSASCTPACKLATLGATVPQQSSSAGSGSQQVTAPQQDGSLAVLIGIVSASTVVAGILAYLMRGEIARLLGLRKPKKDIDDLPLDEIEMPWQKL